MQTEMIEEVQNIDIERVNKGEILSLATWNRDRSPEELLGFIARREAEIFATEA
jgi:hypothetical protein